MKKRTSSIMWGILLIAGAAFIILSAMGYMQDVGVASVIFTIVFAGIIISNIPNWNFWGIFLPLAGICIIYADSWGIQKLSPWPLVVIALLLSGGFSLIFKTGRRNNYNNYNNYNANPNQQASAGYKAEYINQGVNNIANCTTRFSSSVKYVRMENFERANINISFGSMEVYFDGCNIPSGHAIIDINAKFGSLVLYIPSAWKVELQAGTMMGRVNERNRAQIAPNSPVVAVNGVMQCGSVEIQYI